MDLVDRLSWLFGTEEAVKYRRQMVLLREEIETSVHNIDKGCECRVICSGSLGEGVAYPSSDDDLMFASRRQQCHVHDNYDEAINHQALYMIPSVYSPGFCILQNVTALESPFVSSREFREACARRNPTFHLHGPCTSVVNGPFEYDYAQCYLCPRWPTMADEWMIRRRRYGWPSQDLVEEIVRGGCHVVPIGNPDSPLCDLEWRLSFSLAERSLIHAFNHVQFVVYNLLKLILKRVIGGKIPDVLCSYFLKTVLYYAVENFSPIIWVNETIDECYRKCLVLLYHFIDANNCPNYFVPDNNMMKRKVNGSNKLPLLRLVSELMAHGMKGSLHLCGEMSVLSPRLSCAHIELKGDRKFLYGYHLHKLMKCYKKFIVYRCGNENLFVTTRKVLSLLVASKRISRSTDSSFLNLIIKKVFAIVGLQCINLLTRVSKENISRYQILKYGQSMLRIGSNMDVSSGRLQLANCIYMTGRYRYCLTIVQAVLSNIAPYVINCSHNAAAQEMYLEIICNNGHSLDYKVRNAWALDVDFSTERAKYAPLPITIAFALKSIVPCVCSEYHTSTYRLHPLVLAYYLQGLCFYQTRDFDSMSNSVTLLEDSVRKHMVHSFHIFCGRLLLGYLKMIQQNYHASCRCFTSAYLMKDALDKEHNQDNTWESQASLVLIAILLNHIVRTS